MKRFILYLTIVLVISPAYLFAQENTTTARKEMGVSLDYGGLGSTVVSFRMGGDLIYGLFGIGYNYPAHKDDAMVWRAGVGAHIGHGLIFNTNIELKAACFSAFSKMQTWQYSFSLLPALKLTDRWELYFGPDIGYIQTSNPKNGKLIDKALNLWKDKDSSPMKNLYIGFSVGVYYRF